MRNDLLIVGDEVKIAYFVGELNQGIVTKRFHIYGSNPGKFFYEVYLPTIEEYVYIERKSSNANEDT